MNSLRNIVDWGYDKSKSAIFELTESDPEIAHEMFVRLARGIHRLGFEELLLDCSENNHGPGFEISNAAGFNKDGKIPPTFLKYLGFDRVVVGTVTGESYEGSPRPRIKRYSETRSMVNWMALPGAGAEEVAENLRFYGDHSVPITINLMSTPGKEGQDLLKDLEKTILLTRNVPFVNRYEINISCPNTHGSSGRRDTRREYKDQLSEILLVVFDASYDHQEIWIKVSPDQDINGIRDTTQTSEDIRISEGCEVEGFVIGNTTTRYNPRFITSPPNQEKKGGASGNAVYGKSIDVQELFCNEIKGLDLNYKIIACGGINSAKKALERTKYGDEIIEGMQLYTGLIYEGPKLLRELRMAV
tara:strand:- start:3332 stop:4408 length:1077 start_codon:yes stop_codon:yes gene_type:complete